MTKKESEWEKALEESKKNKSFMIEGYCDECGISEGSTRHKENCKYDGY